MGFIYVGRLDELKGVKVLFEAWRIMGADAPLLTVCGKGDLEEWCGRQAQGLNIEMKGYVEREELKRLISQSDALILPTLLYEGFPMTLTEAFSCGTPVICSDLGNAGSLVEEGVTGRKFTSGDARALAEAVRKPYGMMRENVSRVYHEKYTPDMNYRRLEEIYLEVENANRSFGSQRRKFRK